MMTTNIALVGPVDLPVGTRALAVVTVKLVVKEVVDDDVLLDVEDVVGDEVLLVVDDVVGDEVLLDVEDVVGDDVDDVVGDDVVLFVYEVVADEVLLDVDDDVDDVVFSRPRVPPLLNSAKKSIGKSQCVLIGQNLSSACSDANSLIMFLIGK